MPVFNREDYVCECIDSILAQTFADFEFVIIDDGSTDRTMELVSRYDDPRIVTASLPLNCGISAARNAGLRLAGGEFVAVMDSDNVAMPDRLAAQVAEFDSHGGIDVLGTGLVKLADGRELPQQHPREDEVIKAWLLHLNGAAIINGTTMMRRAFIEDHGLSYRNIPVDEDHALWIDCMRNGATFRNLPGHHMRLRRHEGNITSERSPRWQGFQARKTPLRAELLGLWYPELSHRECHAMARLMEFGANLGIEEIGLGLAAAAQVSRYRGNPLGASQPHIEAILRDACSHVRHLLGKAMNKG